MLLDFLKKFQSHLVFGRLQLVHSVAKQVVAQLLLLAAAQVFTTHVLHAQSLFLIAACRIQFHQISHP